MLKRVRILYGEQTINIGQSKIIMDFSEPDSITELKESITLINTNNVDNVNIKQEKDGDGVIDVDLVESVICNDTNPNENLLKEDKTNLINKVVVRSGNDNTEDKNVQIDTNTNVENDEDDDPNNNTKKI